MTWSVEGRLVPASMWRFAGGWTAFTDDLPDVYLIVVGFGADPDGLRFTAITDSTRYGFDVAASLGPAGLATTHALSGPDVLAQVNIDRFHPDQPALMSSQ